MNHRLSVLTPMRAWLLAMVLLVAQAAGLSHRVVHAGAAGQAQGLTQGQNAKSVQARWLPEHQQGTPDCRLIDQLAHADALCGAAVAVPAVLTLAVVAVITPALALRAVPAAVYQARAPPAVERV